MGRPCRSSCFVVRKRRLRASIVHCARPAASGAQRDDRIDLDHGASIWNGFLKGDAAMRVGVPREIKLDEYRVGATPASVREYCAHGHEVIVETDAGAGLGIADDIYRAAGATILDNAEEVFARADMIVKVKEPQPAEWTRLRPGQILFTYLHLAADPEQTKGLLQSGCTAVAYETVTDGKGGLPLLAPMSEVAGRLAIEAAAFALRKPAGGMGKLLGGGTVGTQAVRMAIGLGAEVVVLDRSLP